MTRISETLLLCGWRIAEKNRLASGWSFCPFCGGQVDTSVRRWNDSFSDCEGRGY